MHKEIVLMDERGAVVNMEAVVNRIQLSYKTVVLGELQ